MPDVISNGHFSDEICNVILWILISCFLAFLLYLLLAPFHLEIDSENKLCRFYMQRFIVVKVLFDEMPLHLELAIAGFHRNLKLSGKIKDRKTTSVKQRKENKTQQSLKQVIGLLNSFKIKVFSVDVDTGNREWNGILFPVFYLISRKYKKHIEINFIGNNRIHVNAENSLARIIRAYIKFK